MKTCPMIHTGEKQSCEVLTKFIFKAACLTDCGKKRKRNEDFFVFIPERGFFAVADGMGGLTTGGETALIVTTVLPEMLKVEHAMIDQPNSPERIGKFISECVERISNNISQNDNSHTKSFGSTLTGVWLVEDTAVFVNLGDSRGYLLSSEGRLQQITKDHSMVELLLKRGNITPEEAKTHPARGQLTRFVGMNPPALPEVFIEKIQTGDRILLCSDGLSGMLADGQITEIMNSGGQPEKICRMLINEANDRGGKDNITAIVIEIGLKRKHPASTEKKCKITH